MVVPKIAGSTHDDSRIATMHGITSVPNSGVTSSIIDPKLKRDPTLTTAKNVTSALNTSDNYQVRTTQFKFGVEAETMSDENMSP